MIDSDGEAARIDGFFRGVGDEVFTRGDRCQVRRNLRQVSYVVGERAARSRQVVACDVLTRSWRWRRQLRGW